MAVGGRASIGEDNADAHLKRTASPSLTHGPGASLSKPAANEAIDVVARRPTRRLRFVTCIYLNREWRVLGMFGSDESLHSSHRII
jgi:hypothetical protein